MWGTMPRSDWVSPGLRPKTGLVWLDLKDRPLLRAALEEGRFGWVAASLIVRALPRFQANEEAETAWVDHAEETTIKRLRDELRIVNRDRLLEGRGEPMTPISDAKWHASRARRLGDASVRIAQLAELACKYPGADTVIRFKLPIELASHLLSAVRSERSRLESLCREANAPLPASGSGMQGAPEEIVSGASPVKDSGSRYDKQRSLRAALSFSTRLGFVPEWVALLALVENFAATWDDPRQAPRRPGDRTYIRDGWRCSAPGCSSRRNLEEHHIIYRSRGGADTPSNLVTLCRFHHQQGEHNGLMKCRGIAPLGILWRLGDRGKGGVFRNERKFGTNGSGIFRPDLGVFRDTSRDALKIRSPRP